MASRIRKRRPVLSLAALLLLVTVWAGFQVAHGESTRHLSYRVRSGDTVQGLARQNRLSWKTLAQINNLESPYVLRVGQVLRIPQKQSVWFGNVLTPDPEDVARVRSLIQSEATELDWRYIVVHHSATDMGNAKGFDQFHKQEKHMAHGLAYHFVIDNGDGGPDGRIEVGNRWREQWAGGHTANKLMNEIGIGICLVGNFEKKKPTSKQLESLILLSKVLQQRFGIPDRNVILHRHVAQRGTLCPGKRFPWETLRGRLSEVRLD